jgi:hypothetical protein
MKRSTTWTALAVTAAIVGVTSALFVAGTVAGAPASPAATGEADEAGECGGIGGTIRSRDVVVPPIGGGAGLPGRVYAPDADRQTGPCPLVSMLPGGGAPISSVEWAATRLAASGYVVVITDPSGNTPSTYDVAGRSGITFMESSANPFADATDTDRVGVSGWSLGGRSWTKSQDIDPRIDAVVTMDHLAISETGDLGSPACSNQPRPVRPARVPAMGLASESCTQNGADSKLTAHEHWRAADLATMSLVLDKCTHFCWSQSASSAQHDLNHYYTQAWFDRWLKGDASATERLLARTVLGKPVESVLSDSFRSGVFLDGTDCGDFRAGCGTAS